MIRKLGFFLALLAIGGCVGLALAVIPMAFAPECPPGQVAVEAAKGGYACVVGQRVGG